MRWSMAMLGLLLAGPAAAGLFGGNDAPGRIPVPARDFHGEVEDRGGVRTALDRLSFDGEVYLFGELGRALVTVHFEDIDRVRFAPGEDADHVWAEVRTRAGEEVRLRVESDRPLFGRARFGNYRIEVADVRELDL